MMMNGPQKGSLWTLKGFHKYLFLEEKTKIKLEENLRLEKSILIPFYIFFGQGYHEHAGVGYDEGNSLRYHLYIIPNHLTVN